VAVLEGSGAKPMPLLLFIVPSISWCWRRGQRTTAALPAFTSSPPSASRAAAGGSQVSQTARAVNRPVEFTGESLPAPLHPPWRPHQRGHPEAVCESCRPIAEGGMYGQRCADVTAAIAHPALLRARNSVATVYDEIACRLPPF
jgi:hypothetical protein